MGALLLDLPSAWLKTCSANGWVDIHNRIDAIEISQSPRGVRVLSQYSSSLHVCDVFPFMGNRIFRNVRDSWHFELASTVAFSDNPDISFIIPHRGEDRRQLLELTIRSIASGQASIECIVVEQDEQRRLTDLPGNTRHILASHPEDNKNWHKSFAFNEGIRAATGKIVVCHDGDILVPTEYVSALVEHLIVLGQEVAFAQRLLFYLSSAATAVLAAEKSIDSIANLPFLDVRQNWRGGTLAINRSAYEKIGGFDERFYGWTGEDLEFYSRCQLLDGWFFGYIPFIHLWHPEQQGKRDEAMRQAAEEFTRSRLAIPPEQRVKELLEQQGSTLV